MTKSAEAQAQAQARADRLADLVEDTALRAQILQIAREWRQLTWDAAMGIAEEPRSFLSGHDAAGEIEPLPPGDPADARRARPLR